jgi:hypothetical protein
MPSKRERSAKPLCVGSIPTRADTLGRAGLELPGVAGRGREVVLYGRSPPGGHQSSDRAAVLAGLCGRWLGF